MDNKYYFNRKYLFILSVKLYDCFNIFNYNLKFHCNISKSIKIIQIPSFIFHNPIISTKRTFIRRTLFSPFQYTVQMKIMIALTFNRYALITWHFASRARRFKCKLANSAWLGVLDIPFPCGYSLPAVYFDFHFD